MFAGGGQLEADLFSSSPGAGIESKADNVQGSPEKAAAKKVAPKATPKTTGQNVKRGTFELIPANNGGIIVKGDKAAIRAQLKEAGIDAKGLPMRDGLRFGKSQAEGVRGILEGKPPTKPAESVKTPSESTILATPKKQYINRMIKQAGIKKASPGYKAVVERTEAEYEAELDKAYAEMSFDEYQERNADVPESVNRQAHKQLQDEYGVKADLPSVETVTK
ncbi:MAG: hypothetical protein GY813_19340, partial [Halieaceae bacterium]|nr:hypothetical protein [Halieaceae bacterium]